MRQCNGSGLEPEPTESLVESPVPSRRRAASERNECSCESGAVGAGCHGEQGCKGCKGARRLQAREKLNAHVAMLEATTCGAAHLFCKAGFLKLVLFHEPTGRLASLCARIADLGLVACLAAHLRREWETNTWTSSERSRNEKPGREKQ